MLAHWTQLLLAGLEDVGCSHRRGCFIEDEGIEPREYLPLFRSALGSEVADDWGTGFVTTGARLGSVGTVAGDVRILRCRYRCLVTSSKDVHL